MPCLLSGIASSAIPLSDPRLYQLAHQGNRQGLIRCKADRAFAGVVVFQRVLMRFDDRATHKVESTVVRGRADGDERFAIETERGQAVTDAFLRSRDQRSNGPAQFLERGPLI